MSVSNVETGAAVGRNWKRFIFWEFPRASWPYDVVVALILLFIFMTPRAWFGDQPKKASLFLISSDRGENQVFVASELLVHVPDNLRTSRVHDLIRQRTGKFRKVLRVEPIRDQSTQDLKGFIAYTTP